MVGGACKCPCRASARAGASASARAEKHAGSHVLSEVRASVLCDRVRVRVRVKCAGLRACRATTGPDPTWCQEAPSWDRRCAWAVFAARGCVASGIAHHSTGHGHAAGDLCAGPRFTPKQCFGHKIIQGHCLDMRFSCPVYLRAQERSSLVVTSLHASVEHGD